MLFNTIDEVIRYRLEQTVIRQHKFRDLTSAQWDVRVENQINFINLMFCGCNIVGSAVTVRLILFCFISFFLVLSDQSLPNTLMTMHVNR